MQDIISCISDMVKVFATTPNRKSTVNKPVTKIKPCVVVMKYLSKFPPCFPHSRQNRRNYTDGQDPTAEETVAATDWIGVICLLFHWLR